MKGKGKALPAPRLLRWNADPSHYYGNQSAFLELPDKSRLWVRRERPRGKKWRAFLNGKRTAFVGRSLAQCQAEVEAMVLAGWRD